MNSPEKAMAHHSSTLAWKIPWTEEPGRLQSMGSLRVRHDSATSLSLFTFMHWRRKWQPTPVFLPGESQGRGSLVAAVFGVAQSWTRLKRLSSSSSKMNSQICCVLNLERVSNKHVIWNPWYGLAEAILNQFICCLYSLMPNSNQDCREKYQSPQICRWSKVKKN